ncbi:hypothetical protein N7582_005445 [Saccharomyces uvarum]|mgnify:CR=1 FL=1|uniref:YPL272C-like protein n=1 Tax=Saccharomyces uvarum TaxID=230603 RepID=A0AA35JA09_SACUV|nr:hypothetical protein N7582_005445 [Saccharomyces uvarum]CAI4052456.1 hypothetical protein SUVC_16G0090 [Saccharomyces uvarum]
MTTFRPLSSFEKKLLTQSLNDQRNGTIFSSTYSKSSSKEADADWHSDEVTLGTNSSKDDSRLTLPLIATTLKKLIKSQPALFATVNEDWEYAPLKQLKTSDIVNVIEFETTKDKEVNCHWGVPPPYLLRHAFNKTRFVPGSNKPLWTLYVIDETLLVFHGHDVLFDIFSAANFHKLFLKELNSITSVSRSDDRVLFDINDVNFAELSFPKSIYDSAKLRLPAMTPQILHKQTQSFFKSIFYNTLKRPFGYLTNQTSFSSPAPTSQLKRYNDILNTNSSLCGTTVFGIVNNQRFSYLKSIVNQEHICLRSFICGIAMICLKPLVKDFSGTIVFSIPIDLRKHLNLGESLGLFFKELRIECPLSLIDDELSINEFLVNSNDNENNDNDEFNEKLMEYQFNKVTKHVSNYIMTKLKSWERNGFNDDDIRRMKYDNDDDFHVQNSKTKLIQINDVSDISLSMSNDDKSFKIVSSGFTNSINRPTLMSLSYTYCEDMGLNICIHYPDSYNLESFVECFESFIE